MIVPKPSTLRCAIYTRKSSDEGLEQEFNSLDAQREACEAYIRSQAHEGWRAVPTHFDDGGHSGGTLERPAIQQLLALVRAKQINVIVIYKIDRLTRSLADFARLAELFDQYGVSFVSVTQQFNTTTSMGRLMLNVLLSFAQFERELTGERIRDKIAASKKKGMWMGGFTPLGYDAKDRTLAINNTEAPTVRSLFELYLAHSSITTVWEEAQRRGYRTKARISAAGRPFGAKSFSPGHIHFILKNPIYAGQIAHKGEIHPGLHPRLIDEQTWAAVQAKLADNRTGERRHKTNRMDANPLSGLLIGPAGETLMPTHTVKDGRRYRYYVSNPMKAKDPGRRIRRPRVPAEEIEAVVAHGLRNLLADAARLPGVLATRISPAALPPAIQAANVLQTSLMAPTLETWTQVRALLQRVAIGEDSVTLSIERAALADLLGLAVNSDAGRHEVRLATRIRLRGARMKLIVGNGRIATPAPDPALIKALARAHDWFARLTSGEVRSIREIAAADRLTVSYIRRVIRLAFLAPDVVEAIVERHQPVKKMKHQLIHGERLSLAWADHYSLLATSL
jgi:DNA invertase Pin-like site-specific DNA recombinase